MKKRFALLLVGLLPFATFAADKNETAYERVMRTNTLRCGYITWPPFAEKNLKTGKMSGMNVDFVEAVGKNLGIKIDWAADITPGTQIETLKSGKIDAMCASEGPMYPNSVKYQNFSLPYVYIPYYIYVRTDDTRFDRDWQAINKPDIRVATIDGDVSGFITLAQFPKAKAIAMPQLGAAGQMMMDVAGNKADVLMIDSLSMAEYMKNNPGKLKQLQMKEPIAVLSNTFSTLRGNDGTELINLINQSIEIMRSYRQDEVLLAPYIAQAADSLYLPANSWKAQK